jgi:uncharacterized protein YeaO (DUF488 family)
MKTTIRIKRVYEPVDPDDGIRVLVDRLWPRGISKEQVRLGIWQKDIAPSNKLRKWFNHDLARWDEFRRRYFAELDSNPDAWRPLLELAYSGNVTLLYSARDNEHNNAAVLKDYLESKNSKNERS